MGEEEIIMGFFIILHLPPSLTKLFASIITTQKVSLFLNSSYKQQAVIHCSKKNSVHFHVQNKLLSPEGFSGFQVTGMVEGYFWVCNFRFRDYFGQENFGKNCFG